MTLNLMKGALFVHMVEFAQKELGANEAERVVSHLSLGTGASYTSVGMYPVAEFMALHAAFSNRMNMAPEEFSRRFGIHTLPALVAGQGLSTSEHPFDFLERIHGIIHRDVRKLYTNSNPPDIEVIARDGERCLTLRYASRRPLAAFCGGMLEATLETFKRSVNYGVERIDPEPRIETYAEFRVFERLKSDAYAG